MTRGLLGAALLFWGWQTGLLPAALVMAAVLEARAFVHTRWELTRADFNRVSDLSTVVLVLVGVYQAFTNESARAVTGVIQWLPLVLFALVVCQLYSVAGSIEVAVFFWSQRTRPGPSPPVDLAPAYFGLCLLSASTANARGTFYAGLVGLTAWALWRVRARRSVVRWSLGLALAVALGWVGHQALAEGQRIVERRAQALLLSWARREQDPNRATTSLGDIGELKLSDRIVMRVEPAAGVPMPALLRQASYNVYHGPVWLAVDGGFTAVQSEADGATWVLRPDVAGDQRLTVSAYLPRGRGLLALPNGATRLDDLMVASLARNRLGTVRVDEGLGLVTYTARFAGRGADDGAPSPGDLRVPPREVAAVARVARELGLIGRPPPQVLASLHAYFRRFRYTRYLAGARPGRTALEEFLLATRAGHCEYFASATTLLLREAGIPARYAVGYSAHEWSRVEARWVVRARDAHAWAQAWIDGAWVDVDTTPPDWIAEEGGEGSAWQSAGDLWEWTTFLLSRWRWSERRDRLTGSLGWLLIPLVAVLVWRLWARRRVRAPSPANPASPAMPRVGVDSEFYRVERRLGELGFERAPDQPLARWLDAVIAAAPPAVATAPLRPLLALHYRHRFDPLGLLAGERQQLRAGVEAWLAAHRPGPASARGAGP
jgi:transglutaminase-like putative cysteine protease